MATITVPTKQIAMVKKLFPAYRKRNINIVATSRVTFCDLNWSGGTRSTYTAIDLSTEQSRDFSHWSIPAPWDNTHEGASVNLIPGLAVARTGHFCGKESTLTLYVHPDNMPKLLPAE